MGNCTQMVGLGENNVLGGFRTNEKPGTKLKPEAAVLMVVTHEGRRHRCWATAIRLEAARLLQ
jgi:hypothetical protein